MSTTSTSSGWNRSTSTPKPAPKKPSAMRGVVAGLVVVALAVVCAVVFMGKGEKPVEKTEKKPVRIKEVRPVATNAPAKVVSMPEKPVEKPQERHPGEKVISCVTNNAGYEIEITVDKNGRKARYVHPPKSIWKSGTDELIALAVTTPEGRELPPFPNMTIRADDEFRESLKTPIEILESDSEEVKVKKQIVMEAREAIKERIDQGEHFCQIIVDQQKLFNENRSLRIKMKSELHHLLKEGNETDAKTYVDEVNKHLERLGITPLDIEYEKQNRRN